MKNDTFENYIASFPITVRVKKKYLMQLLKNSEDEAIRCVHLFADNNDEDVLIIAIHPAGSRPV
jgi:hypothetical protein